MRSAPTTLSLLLLCLTSASPAAEPVTISLDGQWDFTYTKPTADEIPTPPPAAAFDVTVNVPGKWDDQLDRLRSAPWFKEATFATALGPVRYLSGIGWHRTWIDAPPDWKDRAVRLTIGWAVGQIHVWLNGRHVGRYDYGVYTPYALDLTGKLLPGRKNELIISVDNTRGFAGGWAFLGNAGKASGISRPVTLSVAPGPGRIDDVYIRPGQYLTDVVWQTELAVPAGAQKAPPSKMLWKVRSAANRATLAEGALDVPPFDASKQVTWQARIDAIKPWRPKEPNLYWTDLQWIVNGATWDARTQRFGLRRWSHDARKLKLNGRTIYLRGDFGHYYFPVHGTTPTDKAYWLDYVRRAKQLGMNYVNFAARVCPPELLEAADELGIVMQCGDHMTVLKEHADHYRDVWTPIVRWTRAHPSLALYGFGGERNYYDGIIRQYQRQYDLIKSLHPECLVMPQQAIRGVDYAFDPMGAKELTLEPFPHHAERLAQYTKACDIFGHYSGGAFGYDYFSGPWRQMEKRFRVYSKPLSMHELFMGMSYLNPDNAAKYTGRVPPYLYTKLKDDLTRAGLIDRWRTYYECGGKLHAICKKYCTEKTRKCNELAGFEFLGMQDMHFTEHYTVGILDEFGRLKPGDTIEGILRYNAESVLLIDFEQDSINRSFRTGSPFEFDLMASLYGDHPLRDGKLTWTLKANSKTVLSQTYTLPAVPTGQVSTLKRARLAWPPVTQTTRFNLAAALKADGYDLANDWDFWVFPNQAPPPLHADADEPSRALLAGRYGPLPALTDASSAKLRVVSRITPRDVDHLADGGDVLLLGAAPFAEYTAWRSFRPGLGAREHHNVGSVIRQHPIFDLLPHDGWGDWQFYPLLEGASCVLFDDDLATPFDPILEIISSAEDVRKHAAIMEKRVGKGRLLFSTCTYDERNPSCLALMDGILRYVQGDKFRPPSDLSPTVLKRLAEPAKADDPKNLLASPGFERDVKNAWLAYGADYRIDDAIARSGATSLRLEITPDALRIDPKHYTGARAKAITFKTTPPALKLAAWHKTHGLTGAKGRSFLIFVYINYAGGGTHTLRLLLDPADHDWQYAETTWRPAKPLAGATLYVGLASRNGTAWIDDVYLGPAAPGPETQPRIAGRWHRRPVTVEFPTEGWYRIGDGDWSAGKSVRITKEGLTHLAFKTQRAGDVTETRDVRIDLTPPTIVLEARPAPGQEGGVYHATPETEFALKATDNLSGVQALEVSIDAGPYRPHTAPLRLPDGAHELRCRATDAAGNRTELMTGSLLTGGQTDVFTVTIRKRDQKKGSR
ncbi:MAG: hypothetical protein JXQ73_22250 [Phycisphaerae bacterium]|nr:hypothetical protein [Phycisphaerae bacterium]